jgi:hypothetical protein
MKGKKLTNEAVGEILQRLYDSEIHFKLGWFWDGGIDFELWDDKLGFCTYATGETDLIRAMQYILPAIALKYPRATFTRWLNQQNFI